eukprot:Sspe_Gene.37668::Locus_18180_Transcript_2_4_Confidence_0.636_Length_788::g.37668::m.37668
MSDLYNKYKDDVQVLALSTDPDRATVEKFLTKCRKGEVMNLTTTSPTALTCPWAGMTGEDLRDVPCAVRWKAHHVPRLHRRPPGEDRVAPAVRPDLPSVEGEVRGAAEARPRG